jgi:hypothetical protein
MSGRIYAAGQAGDDCEPRLGELTRQLFGKAYAGCRSITSPNHGKRGLAQDIKIAAHREKRRRSFDHLQARRIVRLTYGQ